MRSGTSNSFISSESVSDATIAPPKVEPFESRRVSWPEDRLVRECLKGNEEAWAALIDKYKKLIFSIPVKYGFSTDGAADIFQAVCLELLTELPKLRKPAALPKWIMQVTAHKCIHRKRLQRRTDQLDDNKDVKAEPVPPRAEAILREAEEEHKLRQAMAELPPRCRDLVHMLFFEEHPREYRQIAQSLGIAVGSIGFIRQRCLEKLRRRLEEMGF
jgi:RNA polymerase sigma factor (sigma-70 family)